MVLYWIIWYPKNKHTLIWHWWEYLVLSISIGMHIYRFDIFATLCFFMGANVSYALMVLPNHDTWESMANYKKV